jgi:hypothetical protein
VPLAIIGQASGLPFEDAGNEQPVDLIDGLVRNDLIFISNPDEQSDVDDQQGADGVFEHCLHHAVSPTLLPLGAALRQAALAAPKPLMRL